MARIAVLPVTIASRIAAGEVVERPASALKELVENALDASARAIEVRLEGGGRDLIVVRDDGEGMAPDDLLLALERHATSKIRSDADIDQVATLGFRGEALPSIASVSRFTIASRADGHDVATVAEVHAGRMHGVREEPSTRGTRVDVRSLFYNAPARRKFLRSADTERQKAAEVVARFAIAYPHVRFRFSAEGRLVVDHAPAPTPFERCAQVLGRGLTDRLLPVERISGPLALVGLASGLEESRAHTRDQHLYVNRRPIRDRLLAHAIASAYADVLPRGRHPIVILLLTLPTDQVDVNVHPAKAEVRFRRPQEVHAFLTEALRSALQDACAAPRIGGPHMAFTSEPAPPGGTQETEGWRYVPGTSGSFATVPLPVAPGALYAPSRFGGSLAEPFAGGPVATPDARGAGIAPTEDDEPTLSPAPGADAPLPLVPLGQFLESYILAAQGSRLLIVDQHAAHERILFEGIMGSGSLRAPSQRLLEPVTLELGPAEEETALGALEALGEVGFELEPFGKGALLLRSVPAGLPGARERTGQLGADLDHADPSALLRDVLSDLREGRVPAATADARRRVAASTACHAAIKVHFPLTAPKMAWILAELARCQTPTTCPHGRPVFLMLPLEDIERGLHRR
jgi:DNA mismatch repair protein MutL